MSSVILTDIIHTVTHMLRYTISFMDSGNDISAGAFVASGMLTSLGWGAVLSSLDE